MLSLASQASHPRLEAEPFDLPPALLILAANHVLAPLELLELC
jgi:hypothetical protein